MTWEDGGPLEPDPEPEVECPDCLGEGSLTVIDSPRETRAIDCHRCEGTGMIHGEAASDYLQEQAELAAEQRADEARDR